MKLWKQLLIAVLLIGNVCLIGYIRIQDNNREKHFDEDYDRCINAENVDDLIQSLKDLKLHVRDISGKNVRKIIDKLIVGDYNLTEGKGKLISYYYNRDVGPWGDSIGLFIISLIIWLGVPLAYETMGGNP